MPKGPWLVSTNKKMGVVNVHKTIYKILHQCHLNIELEMGY